MRLSGKIDYDVGLINEPANKVRVTNVSFNKLEEFALTTGKVIQVASISEFVHHDNFGNLKWIFIQLPLYKICTNKASTTRN
jgi:hypothetical protein